VDPGSGGQIVPRAAACALGCAAGARCPACRMTSVPTCMS
jgi:hypothetical protein